MLSKPIEFTKGNLLWLNICCSKLHPSFRKRKHTSHTDSTLLGEDDGPAQGVASLSLALGIQGHYIYVGSVGTCGQEVSFQPSRQPNSKPSNYQ